MPQVTTNKYVSPNIIACPTLANLRLNRGPADLSGTAIALLFGNAAAFDQAVLIYVWDHDDVTGDNGTTFIAPTGVTTGRWRKPA